MLPNVTCYGLADDPRSFFLLTYTPKLGFAALQKQWVVMIATYLLSFYQAVCGLIISQFDDSLAMNSDGYGQYDT